MIIPSRAMRLITLVLMLLFAGATIGLSIKSYNQQQALDAFWKDIQDRNQKISGLQDSLQKDRSDLVAVKSALSDFGDGRTEINKRLNVLEQSQADMQREIDELVSQVGSHSEGSGQ